MTELKTLDSETRCFALVGHFLQTWATMELCINDAIGHALRLRPLMQFCLCANMQLRDKLNVLNTLVDISSLTDTERKHFSSTLNSLIHYSTNRNMVAHDPFSPDETELDPRKAGR